MEYTTTGDKSIPKAIDSLVFMIRDKRPIDKELFTYVPQSFTIRQKSGAWIARVKGEWLDKPKIKEGPQPGTFTEVGGKLNETGKGVGEVKNSAIVKYSILKDCAEFVLANDEKKLGVLIKMNGDTARKKNGVEKGILNEFAMHPDNEVIEMIF